MVPYLWECANSDELTKPLCWSFRELSDKSKKYNRSSLKITSMLFHHARSLYQEYGLLFSWPPLIWRMEDGVQATKNATDISQGSAVASFLKHFSPVGSEFWAQLQSSAYVNAHSFCWCFSCFYAKMEPWSSLHCHLNAVAPYWFLIVTSCLVLNGRLVNIFWVLDNKGMCCLLQ